MTQLIAQGEHILVGLEVSAAQQDALDAVMAGKRTPEGIAHPIIDSPSFQKMLSELSELYQTHGPLLTVVAIDALDSEKIRDAAMARNIRHHLASGQFERAVVLVGNLHAIRKMQWAKDAGRKMPYLAERLIDADVKVTSVMQDFDPECSHRKDPTFCSINDRKGLEAVRRQLDAVKHQSGMDMSKVSDGIIIWECQE